MGNESSKGEMDGDARRHSRTHSSTSSGGRTRSGSTSSPTPALSAAVPGTPSGGPGAHSSNPTSSGIHVHTKIPAPNETPSTPSKPIPIAARLANANMASPAQGNTWIQALKHHSGAGETSPSRGSSTSPNRRTSASRTGSISSMFARVGVGAEGAAQDQMQIDGQSPTKSSIAQTEAAQRELVEKSYLNSARIVHNYGVGGIAPLAPLSQRNDGKNIIPVMVSWTGGGRVVHITGTFNNWKQKIRLTKSRADFSTVIDMPAGETHRFKFIVDDEWKCSEDLPIASDSEGNLVNYLDVLDEFGDEIHDGFDGLAHDENVTSHLGESPESSYASKIPHYLNWHLENQAAAATAAVLGTPSTPLGQPPPLPTDPPPLLPPHLEKVFLNAPVPVTSHRDDNLILPIPSSVTLNHLYACSIRDNVMALSTTTRYKQKYVTTILYKPVLDKVA
ncbi:5'-AMP-activated protein kinase beta subunit, interation domain-containing protein [Chytriomyces cf. hyalinus JEL632]|nr:5'-AMP-activated protein kinase beta subunit, interation domain-containing protein [Chytriomyces cf. hyalinus JEL632]